MNLQYISDSKGQTTGVFIPIKEWNQLKNKYKGIEHEDMNIPEWHKDTVRQRFMDYKTHTVTPIDFDSALEDIEKEI
jgi:hypothetical protein